MRIALAVCSLLLLAPAAALAREPVISYVDENGVFRLYDEETEAEVDPPPPVPTFGFLGGFRYSMSQNGRYVVYTDTSRKLHLLDRATNGEVPLPGIDVYTAPDNLTVSNDGLIGFDKQGDGPVVVYSSAGGQFIDTGLADNNGHRQPRLSGDGHYLGTTCIAACEAMPTMTGGADAFVQNLSTKSDDGFPADETRDEEHPCLDGDGSLFGIDKAAVLLADSHPNIFLFEGRGASPAALTFSAGPADPAEDERYCVLDTSGRYLGYENAGTAFQLYDRTLGTLVSLPSDKEFDRFSVLSDPYSPPQPPSGGGPSGPTGPTGDRTKPVASRFRMTHRRFRVGRRATAFKFRLSEPANARIVIRRLGRKVGEIRRRGLAAGSRTISFNGKLRGRKLRRGGYVAVLIVTDKAGNVSLPVLIEFKVLRPLQRRH